MPAVLLEIPIVRNASDESRLFEAAQRQRPHPIINGG